MRHFHRLLPVFFALFFIGCAHHVPNTKDINISTKYTKASESLYYLFRDDIPKHAPKTGFYPLTKNIDAFSARMQLIHKAKHTLDLQYYLFIPDNVGLAITHELLAAADRGVKVRLLLDDMLMGFHDDGLAALNAHPNIEIKLFNPTTFRKSLHYIQMGLHVDTLGRRMHNKIFIADNSVAILGGRNIQDLYFSADEANVFIDNDILAAGPMVAAASNEFETYWNAPVCKPITGFSDADTQALEQLRTKVREYLHTVEGEWYINWVKSSQFYTQMKQHQIPLSFGDAELYFDLPTKVILSEDDTSTHLSSHIEPVVTSAQKSLVIVSPYFIPNAKMMQFFKEARERGVDITVITNSLPTNDGIPVYAAYKKYQIPLLELGVHLYEINPYAFHSLFRKNKYRKGRLPRTSLHAKTMVVDENITIIGSANLDPRSKKLNTEVVAIIYSEDVAKQELESFYYSLNLENLFELSLEDAPPPQQVVTYVPHHEHKRVVWTTIKEGKKVKYYNDANAGFWRRLLSNLSVYLPIEGYL